MLRKVLMGMAVMGIAGSMNSYASMENRNLDEKHLDSALENGVVDKNPVKIIIDALDAQDTVLEAINALGKQRKEEVSASLEKFKEIADRETKNGPTEYWKSHIERWIRTAELINGATDLLCGVNERDITATADKLYTRYYSNMLAAEKQKFMDPIISKMFFMDPISQNGNWESVPAAVSPQYKGIILEMNKQEGETRRATEWFLTLVNHSLFVAVKSAFELLDAAYSGFGLVWKLMNCDGANKTLNDAIAYGRGLFDCDGDSEFWINELKIRIGEENAKKIVDMSV